MSRPGDVPRLLQPLTAVSIHQLLKDDYKSRRPRRCLNNIFCLVGFFCLMSGISYAKAAPRLEAFCQSANVTCNCECICPSPATTLPTPYPSPATTLPTPYPSPEVPYQAIGEAMFQVGEAGEFEAPKYFNRSLYFRGKQKKTFGNAQNTCLKYNATLTDSSSNEENQFIYQKVLVKGVLRTWLNARQTTNQPMKWQWLSGPDSGRKWTVRSNDTPIYQNWHKTEPSQSGDCLAMYWDGTWTDTPCSGITLNFICKFTI